jgi:hypothetical protein
MFKLCGRDKVIEKIAKILSFIEKEDWVGWSHFRGVPVCTGMPGLGKTRMLEEWERIFDKAAIGTSRLGIIIPYDKEFEIIPVENELSLKASLSWRLLY